jgi:predicted nucleic-acid-binding protein
MIGVDTNVLLRLFVPVEPQREVAVAFFGQRSAADPAFVSTLVVTEFAWVLRRRYKYEFEQVGQAIRWMLDSDDFVLEDRDLLEWALANYTRSRIDFSDLLVARSSELAGASRIVTFDRDAAKYVPGMDLLK